VVNYIWYLNWGDVQVGGVWGMENGGRRARRVQRAGLRWDAPALVMLAGKSRHRGLGLLAAEAEYNTGAVAEIVLAVIGAVGEFR
jgi:hypothetical protein